MTPTNKLRFVEREITTPVAGTTEYFCIKPVKILQQLWIGEGLDPLTGQYIPLDEWRDVPVEVEK